MNTPDLNAKLRTQSLLASAVDDDAGALRDRAERDGYLFFRSLLQVQPLLELRQAVLGLCSARGWLAEDAPIEEGRQRAGVRLGAFDDDFVYVQSALARSAAYGALRDDPTILGVLEKLFGEPAVSGLGSICRIVSPGAQELTTLPHQDRHYAKPGVNLWTVWIPLGDCSAELGGLAVLAGSHREGPQPHDVRRGHLQGVNVADDTAWRTADYICGDVLMFHGLTLHRACDNVSTGRLRISVDHRYQPQSGPGLAP